MSACFKRNFIAALVLICIVVSCNGQTPPRQERSFSTAIASMQQLVRNERMAIETLDEYADELQKRVEFIKDAVALMRKINVAAGVNSEEYLKNPINAFNLVRRTHEDWRNWLAYLALPVGSDKLEVLDKVIAVMPTKNDVIESIDSILLLQETYEIKTDDFANGVLRGKQYGDKMSDLDAYRIGEDLLGRTANYDAAYWLEAALRAYEPNLLHTIYDFNKQTILENYAQALLKQNRFDEALKVLNDLQANNPQSEETSQYLLEVKALAEQQPKPAVLQTKTAVVTTYHVACRGGYDQRYVNLHCRYNTNTTPFLRLAPIKYEEISLEPYILIYHDVVYDKEIEALKEMATPSLKRATVFQNDSRSTVNKMRTAHFAWFEDSYNELIQRLNKRITDMTGFIMTGSEMLQMANYGLGGFYMSHYDYFDVPDTADVVRLNGNRKATALFYLTDVPEGGTTVFPSIGISVQARKGTALMWYNLDNKGKPDPRSLHAACPVLYGNKWVFTKWIRERNQMFRHPCLKQG